MSLHVLPDLEQRSDEWFAQRLGMVTASVVGKLVTVRAFGAQDYDCPACDAPADAPCVSKVKRGGESGSPIKTMHPERVSVSIAKRDESPTVIEIATGDEFRGLVSLLTAERVAGFSEPTFTSADMWRGIDGEPLAVEHYAKHYAPVKTVGFMVRDDWGFRIGYSPDGLVGDDGLVEVKCPRSKNHMQTILADEVPAYHMAQLQTGLLVSGRKWIDFISYCGGMPLWVKRVTPDERWFAAIESAVREFEKAAEEMADKYLSAVVGLPMTERVIEEEMSL